MRYFFKAFAVFFLLASSMLFSQKSMADSLEKQLNYLSGPAKVDVLNRLSSIYESINTNTAIDYAQKGLDLAKSIHYDKGIATSYGCIGYCYLMLDNRKAYEYTNNALKLRQKIGDKSGIATSLNVLGVLYYYTGNYLTAIDYHLKAMEIREELHEEMKLAGSYNNLALIYIALGNYDAALDYLIKALNINIKNGRTKNATINDNIGDVYSKMGNYKKALEYFNKSLAISKVTGYKKTEANSYFNFARVYHRMKDTTNAFKYYRLSLNLYTEIEEPHGIANTENGMAMLYSENKDFKNALPHALIALKHAEKITSLDNIYNSANVLQQCYADIGDYKKAYKYMTIFHEMSDSLMNNDKYKRIARVESNYKMERIKKEKEAEISKQQYFIIGLVIFLVFLIAFVILIIWDYKHKRQLNNQLNKLNLQLQDAVLTKDKFFSIIAHDLKSPFQGLMGFSQILEADYNSLSEIRKKEIIEDIEKLSVDTYKLLENLLEWANIQRGKIKINPVEINVYDELFSTIALLSQTAKNKNISLKNKLDENIVIKADKYMFQTIIRNLISNAVKFTKQSGTITIASNVTEETVAISVSDTGVGMKKNILDNLFILDKAVSTKGTENENGTGLGLLLCKEMIELHKGTINVKSELGKGSEFTITFPRE